MARRPDGLSNSEKNEQEYDELMAKEETKEAEKKKAKQEAEEAVKEKARTQPCCKLMWAKFIGLHLDDLMCASVMVA